MASEGSKIMDSTHRYSQLPRFSSVTGPKQMLGQCGDPPNTSRNASPAVFESLPFEASSMSLVDFGILLVWVVLLYQCAFPDTIWPAF
jgi:hypothetical protein